MRNFLVCLFLVLFVAPQARAQLIGEGVFRAVPAASYVGPGDVVSGALAWYGLRAYNSATRGNPLVNVCNSTGGVDVGCADLSSSATTGALVAATVSGITCPGANCTIKLWYDQSGNGITLTQNTIANRAALTASCLGSEACAVFTSASSQSYSSSGTVSSAQPYTMAGAYSETGVPEAGIISVQSAEVGLLASGTAGFGLLYDVNTGGASFAISDSVFHVVQGIWNGASSVANVDNTTTTGNSTTALSGKVYLGVIFSDYPNASVFELGIWGLGFSSGQQTSMCHNSHTYWGTVTSC
jgi:hypothetical protein